MEKVICSALHIVNEHPTLLLLPISALVWLAYKVVHPELLPGLPSTLTLLLPGYKQSHPYSATLSPIAHLRARLALRSYARSQGKSTQELVQQLKEDEEYDWANGDKPKKGDFVRGWDRAMIWDKDCIDLVVLESWRDLSDTLADNALKSTSQRGSPDTMLQIAQHKVDSDNKRTEPEATLVDFWQAVDRRPPRGSGAIGLEWYRKRGLLSESKVDKMGFCEIDKQFSTFAPWKSQDQPVEQITQDELDEEARILKRGKDMFYRYGPPILVGLMHVGLSGGFASPRITDVLKATGYLMSGRKPKPEKDADAGQRLKENVELGASISEGKDSKTHESTLPSEASSERTFKRLLETMSFVLDVMEDPASLHPPSMSPDQTPAQDGKALIEKGGKGWFSCCQVRFIHTNVRKRLSMKETTYPSSSGVPINQEDLLATLTSFSVAPLYTLQRMGISPSTQEREDYIALWRHIGFYMGIEPRLLQRVFRDADSAERFFCCVASHHFLAVTNFKQVAPPPSISSYFGRDLEEVRRFDFDQGPALPLLYSVARRPPGNMNFSTLCNMSRFLLGDALANAVSLPGITFRQYLGIRLRLFVLAYPPLFARYYPRKQFGEDLLNNCRGLLRRVIIWSMKGEIVSFDSNRKEKKAVTIEIGQAEGKRLQKEYFHLMYELLAVSTTVALIAGAGLYYASSLIVGALASLERNYCTI